MIQDPDHALIDRVLSGDEKAYEVLIRKHQSYVYTIALRIIQNQGEAEEAAQDVFLKAYQGLKNFNRTAKFSTWIYRIAFNTAVSYKRKNPVSFEDIDRKSARLYASENNVLEANDKSKFVEMALGRMNEADRTALSLFYLQEMSLEEIAEVTGIAINTIKVRIHRARQRMGEELKMILQQEALTL